MSFKRKTKNLTLEIRELNRSESFAIVETWRRVGEVEIMLTESEYKNINSEENRHKEISFIGVVRGFISPLEEYRVKDGEGYYSVSGLQIMGRKTLLTMKRVFDTYE